MKYRTMIIASALVVQPGVAFAQPEPVNGSDDDTFICPQMNPTGLSDGDRVVAEAVYKDVCDIFDTTEFKKRISDQSWSVGCRRAPFLSQRRIQGPTLLSVLKSDIPAFEIQRGEFPRASTVASTSVYHLRVKIRGERFEGWNTNDRERKAAIVNTMAHEMAHLVARPGTNNIYRFTDGFNWAPWCDRNQLVSYGVGGIVEDIWLRNNPEI